MCPKFCNCINCRPETPPKKRAEIPANRIKPQATIQHQTLPPELLERAKRIKEQLGDTAFESMTPEVFADGFRYDKNPENEIIIWENIVEKLGHIPMAPYTLERRKKRLSQLLGSTNDSVFSNAVRLLHYNSYKEGPKEESCFKHEIHGEICWGQVEKTSNGWACQGHLEETYTREFSSKNKKFPKIEQDRHSAAQEMLKDENQLWWTALSEPVLRGALVMIGEGIALNPKVLPELRDLRVSILAEILHRKLAPTPDRISDLSLAPKYTGGPDLDTGKYYTPFSETELKIDFKEFPDRSLILWNACASLVVDLLTLERGVRQVVTSLWNLTSQELKSRKLASESLK